MLTCDSTTGVCLIPDVTPAATVTPAANQSLAVHYIGDPMCSWCWGISPTVAEVADFCAANGIDFTVTMGGLRAGGGDPWTPAFRDFLRNEWRHIAQVSGQPFGLTLLDAEHFDYDTEPACRAVVTAQLLQARHELPAGIVLKFLAAVQRQFYVDGKDPKTTAFYAGICTSLGLDFDEFRTLFESTQARQATQQAFVRCRQWGVRSFPTLLIERDGVRTPLAVGAVKAEQIIAQLQQALAPSQQRIAA